MSRFLCTKCDYIYNENEEEKTFSELDNEWKCPVCSAKKKFFKIIQEQKKRITGEITDIWDETPDVKTFRIKTKGFWFTPGEYCFLSFEKDGKKYGPKPFTFSSSPNGEFIDITIKKIGTFTQTIHSLEAKHKLDILGPLGEDIHFNEKITKDLVFISMGVGIAPLMSSLKHAHKHDMKNKITILCTYKTEKDIIFKKELDKFNEEEKYDIIYFLTKEDKNEYEKGRISKESINRLINNPEEKIWFVCGSTSFSTQIKKWLLENSIKKENIRVEKFSLPSKTDRDENNK